MVRPPAHSEKRDTMLGTLIRANDQVEVESFLTCLGPYSDSFTDEETFSFSYATFTAECSLMTSEEQTYLQLKGIEIMMKDSSWMFMAR